MPVAGVVAGGGVGGARPGRDAPPGTFHGFDGADAAGAGGVVGSTSGARIPGFSIITPGGGAGTVTSPAAAAAAIAGSSCWSSFAGFGSGNMPGVRDPGARSCVMFGDDPGYPFGIADPGPAGGRVAAAAVVVAMIKMRS